MRRCIAAKVALLLSKPCCQRADLAGQLSDLFYFRDQGLAELAEERLAVLAREYPEVDLAAALNGLGSLDVGGYVVQFGPDRRHGNHHVELAVIGRSGQFRF